MHATWQAQNAWTDYMYVCIQQHLNSVEDILIKLFALSINLTVQIADIFRMVPTWKSGLEVGSYSLLLLRPSSPKMVLPILGDHHSSIYQFRSFLQKRMLYTVSIQNTNYREKNIRNVLCILFTQYKKPKYILIHIQQFSYNVHSTFLYMCSIYVQMYNDQHCLSLLHRFFSDPLFHHKRKWHLILYQWCPPWRQCGVYFT